ncbi:cytochrome P450 [Colletotrichum godetiae]|uniref:Cytochrome P450 n=1 Tax=Colletotrichum godetiae TaxID=1209918 RepID=A0AAJ0AHF0_9PEZI|nr:cytochrome P450 [Colletotrichum godetiae]KAK1673931.1 cytochrome P450 [Colletotrichum godetiae]
MVKYIESTMLSVHIGVVEHGHSLFLRSSAEFQTRYMNIAPTLRIDIFGEGYIITDPVNIETILSTRFEDFGLDSRRLRLMPLPGEGIFTDSDLTAFGEHTDMLLLALEHESQKSAAVDLQPHFFEYTLGTTTHLLFGEPHHNLPKKGRLALRHNFDYATLISAIRLHLSDLSYLCSPKNFQEACKVVRDWATFFSDKALDFMEEHGEEAAKSSFIVNLWRDTRQRHDSLSAWLDILVRNPELIERLKSEMASAAIPDNGVLTGKHIQELPFLSTPSIPVASCNFRIAFRTTVLPRGVGPDGESPVLIRNSVGHGWSTYHLHRHEAIYGTDASIYRPSLWEDGDLIRKAGLGGFLDFHGGPRVCLGTEDYAIMEASYAIVRMLQKFPGIRLPPGVPNEPVGMKRQHLGIVLTSAEGAQVLLE